MRLIAILLVSSISLVACGEVIRGNGKVTKQERSLAQFNSIKTSGVFEIELVKGDPHLVVETDENIHDHIRTEVNGMELLITSDDKHLDAKELKIIVYYDALQSIDISGAAEVNSEGVIRTENFSLDISGAAEAELELDVQNFDIDLSGAADLDLKGRANHAKFDLSGASEVKAEGFEVNNAEVEISGGGEMTIHVLEHLSADISGAGEIKYIGDPEVTKQVSGAGEIRKIK